MGRSPSESSKPRSVSQLFQTVRRPAAKTYETAFEDSVHSDSENTSTCNDSGFLTLEIKPQECCRKSVKFSNLEVREYIVVIGDHPCCTMGCPLSLGWDYQDCIAVAVDRYEATRSPRRSRSQLKTSREERRKMLEGGHSETELRRAERRLFRERSSSAKVCNRLNETFFSA